MRQETSNSVQSLKLSVMSLLIIGACGAIAYNVLLQQSPQQKLPGSTAVRVQVGDIEISDVAVQKDASSIGELLSRTTTGQNASQDVVLTTSIQNELAYLGFYKGAPDGKVGPQTFAAIRYYQQRNSLKPTGQVSRQLLDHLRFTRKISDASNNTGSITASGQSPGVARVQEQLTLFGYLPGEADGFLGRSTINAIKQFESDRSLPVTGAISHSLLQELGI